LTSTLALSFPLATLAFADFASLVDLAPGALVALGVLVDLAAGPSLGTPNLFVGALVGVPMVPVGTIMGALVGGAFVGASVGALVVNAVGASVGA
jgi:hypothetical protein